MTIDPSESSDLLSRVGEGDAQAMGQLLETHRTRLRRMVRLRLNPRLQGRIDLSDVIQEAYLEAGERLAEYLRDPKKPFFLWLRFLTGQKLLELRRHHLGTQARDAARELSIYQGCYARGQLGVPGCTTVGQTDCSPWKPPFAPK